MKEYTEIDGKIYISSSRASEISAYSKDYIGQLCRAKKIESRMVGRTWYVNESSLLEHKRKSEEALQVRYAESSAALTRAQEGKSLSDEVEKSPLSPELPNAEILPVQNTQISPVISASREPVQIFDASQMVAPAHTPIPPISWKISYEADDRPLLPMLTKELAQAELPVADVQPLVRQLTSVKSPFISSAEQIARTAALIIFLGFGVVYAMHPSESNAILGQAGRGLSQTAMEMPLAFENSMNATGNTAALADSFSAVSSFFSGAAKTLASIFSNPSPTNGGTTTGSVLAVNTTVPDYPYYTGPIDTKAQPGSGIADASASNAQRSSASVALPSTGSAPVASATRREAAAATLAPGLTLSQVDARIQEALKGFAPWRPTYTFVSTQSTSDMAAGGYAISQSIGNAIANGSANFNGTSLTITGAASVGSTKVNGSLTVNGPTSLGGPVALSSGTNVLLSADASGNLMPTTSPSVAAIFATSTTATSTFAGAIQVGSAVMFTPAVDSLFIGNGAGLNVGPTGGSTAIGYQALASVTTGWNNTAIGALSGTAVTTGDHNTFVGRQSGASVTSGDSNVFVGNLAGGTLCATCSGDVYVGRRAGNSASSTNSVLIGDDAGVHLTGDNNIVLGGVSLDGNNYVGSNNIFIGSNVETPSANVSGLLNIGNLIFGTNLGAQGTEVATGTIGIGTSTPSATLAVQGGGLFSGDISAANITATGTLSVPDFMIGSASPNTVLATDANGHVVSTSTVTANNFWATSSSAVNYFAGKVGVGTTSPSANLGVQGSAYISGDLTVGGNSITLGNSTSNTLTINSAVTSDIVPNQNNTYRLGSPSFYWNDLYINNVHANNISAADTTIGGTTDNNFIINSDNASADAESSTLVFSRGTVVPNAVMMWDATNKQFNFNQSTLIQNESTNLLSAPTLIVKGQAAQTGDLFQVASSSGAYALNITSDSRIGLGNTTNPAGRLANTSTAGTDGGQQTNADALVWSSSLPGYLASFTNTTTGSDQNGLLVNVADTGNNSNALNVVSGSNVPRLTVKGNGNVGVGTSSPSSLFSIGNNLGNGGFYFNAVGFGIGSANPQSTLDVQGTGSFNTPVMGGTTFAVNTGDHTPAASGSTQNGGFRIAGGTGSVLALDTGVSNTNGYAWLQAAQNGNLATFGNIVLNPNGGKVGIGTANPQAKLDVRDAVFVRNADGAVGSNDGVEIATDSSAPRVSLVQGGRYVGLFSADAPGNIYLKNAAGGDTIFMGGANGGVETARLTNAGSLGIGTSSPSAALAVQGSGLFSGNVSAANITATGTATINNLAVTGSTAYTGTGTTTFAGDILARGVSAWKYLNAPFILATSTTATSSFAGGLAVGSNSLNVLQNGYVGVGTSTPQGRLSVYNNVSTSIGNGDLPLQLFSSGDNTYSGFDIYSPSNPNQFFAWAMAGSTTADTRFGMPTANGAFIFANAPTGQQVSKLAIGLTNDAPIYFANNNAVRMTIASTTGNVGIGTTTPSTTFAVQGSGLFSGGVSVASLAATSSISVPTLNIIGGYNSNPYSGIMIGDRINPANTAQIYDSANTLKFYNGSDIVSIMNNGHVGIGTTTPAKRLDVYDFSDSVAAMIQGSGNGAVGIGSVSTGPFLQGYTNDSAVATGPLVLQVSGGNTILNPTLGNVAIGTTTPASLLTLATQSGNATLTIDGFNQPVIDFKKGNILKWETYSEAATGNYIVRNTQGTASNVFTLEAGAPANTIYANASGNVGIGTTTPVGKLNVVGQSIYNNDSTVALSVADNTTPTKAVHIGFDSSLNRGFIQSGNFGTQYLDTLINSNGGNVGIGTTTPNDLLTLYAGASEQGLRITTATANRYAGLTYNPSTDIINLNAYTGAANGRGLSINVNTPSSPITAIFANYNGNVGIGTTTPTVKFSVGGSAGDTTGHGYFTGGLGVGLVNTTAGSIQSSGAITANGNLNTAGDMALTNAGAAAIRETGGGYLVIGTNSNNIYLDPASQLFIRPAGGHTAMTVSSGASVVNYIDVLGANTGLGPTISAQTTGSDANIPINISGKGTGAIVLNGSGTGNVGIGTTTPNYKLAIDVASGTVQPGLELNNSLTNGTQGRGSSILFTGTGEGNLASIRASTFTASNNTGGLAFQTSNNGALSTQMTIDQNGNVGVGTTSPSQLLSVASGPGSVSAYFAGRVGIGTSNPGDALAVSGGAVDINNGDGVNVTRFNYNNGSTNYIRGTTFFDQAPAYFTGGNVGIGTTSPVDKLQVVASGTGGESIVAATNGNNIFAGGHGLNVFSSVVTGGLGLSVGSNNTSLIQSFKTTSVGGYGGSSEDGMLLLNPSGGNVGIGTTNPLALLHVEKANAGGPMGLFINNSAASTLNNESRIDFGTWTSASPSNIINARIGAVSQSASTAATDLAFSTYNGSGSASGLLERMRITNGGGVGIGTTTPYQQVSIVNGGSNALAITGLGGARYIMMGNQDSAGVGTPSMIGAANGALMFGHGSDWTNSVGGTFTQNVTLTSGGNFGIGNTNPLYKLSLQDSSAALQEFKVGSTAFGYLGSAGSLFSGQSQTDFGLYGNGHNVMIGGRASPDLFVSTTGNVGIGTTSPLYHLDVQGSGAVAARFSGTTGASSDNVQVRFAGQKDGELWAIGSDVAGGGSTGDFEFYNLGNAGGTVGTKLTILGNGNVGIGQTNPGSKLDVNGQVRFGNAGVDSYFSYGSDNDFFLTMGNSPTSFGSIRDANGVEYMRVLHGGNVGIGTTSPYAALSVAGATGVVANQYYATSTTATSTFAGGLDVGGGALRYDYTSGATSISNLELGNMTFDSDSGVVNWADMPVTSASAAGTVESYTAALNGNPMITVFGKSDGAGGVTNLGVGVGSTSPWGQLSVNPNGVSGPAFVIGSSTATAFMVDNAGRVAINSSVATSAQLFTVTNTSNVRSFYVTNAALPAIQVANNSPSGPIMQFLKERGGNINTQTAVQSGDILGLIMSLGYDGTTHTGGTQIQSTVNGTVSAGVVPADMQFFTTNSTGTTNEVMRLANTGNVGIGTTTPTEKLMVTNNGSYAALAVGNGNAYSYFGYAQTATNYTNGSLAGDAVIRGVNGVNISGGNGGPLGLRVDSSGNVGIGVTSPTAPLDVRYPYAKTDTTRRGIIGAFSNDATNPFGLSLTSIGAASLTSRTISLQTQDQNLTNGGNLALQDSGGNVGIGTSTPAALLSVGGSAITSQGFYVDSNGVVGIGDSNPSATALRLHISGSATQGPGSVSGTVIDTSLTSTKTVTTAWILGLDVKGTYNTSVASGSSLGMMAALRAGSGATIANLSNGTITTAAGADFEAPTLTAGSGAINKGATVYIGSAPTGATNNYAMYSASGNNYFGGNVGLASTSPWAQLSVNPNGVSGPEFAIGSTTKTDFVVANSGYVGIGTTSPIAKLSVNLQGEEVKFGGSSGNNFFRVYTNGDSNGGIGLWQGGQQSVFSKGNMGFVATASDFNASNIPGAQMTLTTSGNVGIGTTSPQAKFHIGAGSVLDVNDLNTTGLAAGMFNDTGGSRYIVSGQSADLVLTAKNNVTNQRNFAITNGGGAAGRVDFIAYNDLMNSFTVPIMSMNMSNLNVSIGTTTTNANNMTSIYATTGRRALELSSSAGLALRMMYNNDSLRSADFTLNNNGDLALDTANNRPIILNGNTSTGNVGIGTVSPTAALQVAADHANEGSDHTAQIMVTGVTDANMRLMLGYDTTDNNGYIQSFQHHTGATTLSLQPQGGNVGIGTTTAPSTLTIGAGSLCVDQGPGTATIKCGTTAGNIYYAAANTGAYDVAENYSTSDITANAGDIMTLNPSAGTYMLRKAVAGDKAFGVISTKPGLILGGADAANADASSTRPIALSGRVPVKVDAEGGAIAVGDAIALSSIPGVGKKAGPADDQVGIALEAWSGSQTDMGTIQVFVSKSRGVDQNHVAGSVAADAFIVNNSTTTASASIPSEALTTGGTGVDLFKLSSYVLSGVRTQKQQLDTLALTVSSTSAAISTSSMTIFDLVGLTKEQGDMITAIQTRVDTLAAQIGALGTTTASLQASLASLQTQVQALQNAQTSGSGAGSTTADTQIASSTLASAVQGVLTSIAEWTVSKLSASVVYADRVEAKTVAVSQGFDITDQATGTVWCVTIKNGDWTKVPWSCETPAQNVAAAAGAQSATYTEPIMQTSTANVTQTNVSTTQNAYTATTTSTTTSSSSTSTTTATTTTSTAVQPDQTATTTATTTISSTDTGTVTATSTSSTTATSTQTTSTATSTPTVSGTDTSVSGSTATSTATISVTTNTGSTSTSTATTTP